MRESTAMVDIADPRRFPEAAAAPADARAVHALAQASLAATTGIEAEACGRELDARIDREHAAADPRAAGERLALWLSSAPSVAIYRHLWRALVQRTAAPPEGGVAVTLFAIPLVIVAGLAGGADARATIAGVLPDAAAIGELLVEHGALGGNRSFALAGGLVQSEALDVATVPALLAARRASLVGAAPLALPGSPLALAAGESVHLRFLVGSALGAAAVDVTREATTGRWGLPLTRALSAQLAPPQVTLLVLPRPAFAPLAAVAHGRAAQRDASAQLFASNAIRDLRARVGEPAAVVSAHQAADAPAEGELRLSLSSPFSPRDAHGFRCPILPGERAADVARMLVDLCADARLTDVRIVGGVHADRDPLTGGPLMFKPATMPGVQVH